MMRTEKKRMIMLGIMLVLALTLSLALTACGSDDTADSGEDAAIGAEVENADAEDSEDMTGMLPVDVLDMDGPLVVINTEGIGNIARTVAGTELVFDDEYPPSQIIDHLVKGTTLTIGAKPTEDDWEFVKWTVNGEDYSTDEQTTVTADEDLQIVAVFEFKEQ